MPALKARCSWIDMQQAEGLVVFHLQDVRMSSHKQLWGIGVERRADARVIVAGIAADVLDEHVDILALEPVQFTVHQPQVPAVAVATDSPERTEGSQFLCYLHTTDIPCVPDFVAGFEVLLVPIAVRITQYTYLLHILNRLRINSAIIFSVSISPSTLESMQRS